MSPMTTSGVLVYIPLAALVLAGCQGPGATREFDPWTQSARYELEHRVGLGRWASAEPGAVRVWLPTPAVSAHQRVLSSAIDSPWAYRRTRDANGNRFVYLEPGGGKPDSSEVVMRFVVERLPHDGIAKSSITPDAPLDPRRYLGGLRRIPLEGKVKENARRAGADVATDAQRIRAYYDHVTATMTYSKHGVGWGRGDAVWACDARYGNCTDFHSVLIGMCRSQGIAARFVMGYSIAADKATSQIHGYHCWAEAYNRDFGWLPMDASEAWKEKRLDDYFGRLPSNRVEYTVGRDLVLEPPQAAGPLNYIIHPYVEVDGQPAGEVPWTLRVRRTQSAEPTTPKAHEPPAPCSN